MIFTESQQQYIESVFDKTLVKAKESLEESLVPALRNIFKNGIIPSSLTSGEMINSMIVSTDGYLQSENYVPGATGWKLTSEVAYLPSLDLSGYLSATGGKYKTAPIGSRVEIFPDLSTGIIAYDSTGTAVFTVLVGGTDEGDVIMGSATKYAKWDKSAANFSINGAVVDGTTTIGGRLASVLNTAIDSAGHFADAAFSTATSTIITPFTFGASGALQIGTYANGVSGDLKISPAGILARNSAGETTFFLNGNTGVISGSALVVGTNVGIGTAQTAGNVTTIIGNTVTTGFVNALNITANSMSVGGLTSGTIYSKQISLAITAGTGDSYIAFGGKTDFDATNAGAILGCDDSDSDKFKMYIVNSTAKYFYYDGANIKMKGGTIVAPEFQTADDGSNRLSIKASDAADAIKWYNAANSERFSIKGNITDDRLELSNASGGVLYWDASKQLYAPSGTGILGKSDHPWDKAYINTIYATDTTVEREVSYGSGSGGSVEQQTNKETDVEIDTICGGITTAAGAIGAGSSKTFKVLNDKVSTFDLVLINANTAQTLWFKAELLYVYNGYFYVRLYNIDTESHSNSINITFRIFKNSTS